ncbi:MAG: CPBP family intramembrane metalloprotease [Candidatus Acidiferrum sp.]
MENEVGGSPNEQWGNQKPSPDLLKQIFFNDLGLRAGWRFLIYVLLVVGIGLGTGRVVSHFVGHVRGTPPVRLFFLQEIIGFAVVFGAAMIMARIERRPVGGYGIPLRGAFGKLFWQGWLFGLCEVSALVGLIAAFGGYTFGSLALHGTALLRWGLIWGVFFVFVGFFEEFMFRGYSQYTLGEGIGFWPAAILLSVGFGAIHLLNPGEGLVGAASVVVVGLFLALTLKRTGNLWFAIGLHASFDFGETFLFSVPNSGVVMDGHLSNSLLHGAKWLTGGTVGPEGSVFSFLTMGLLAIAIHYCYPAKNKRTDTSMENK